MVPTNKPSGTSGSTDCYRKIVIYMDILTSDLAYCLKVNHDVLKLIVTTCTVNMNVMKICLTWHFVGCEEQLPLWAESFIYQESPDSCRKSRGLSTPMTQITLEKEVAASSSLCVLADCKAVMCVLPPAESDRVHTQVDLGTERCCFAKTVWWGRGERGAIVIGHSTKKCLLL